MTNMTNTTINYKIPLTKDFIIAAKGSELYAYLVLCGDMLDPFTSINISLMQSNPLAIVFKEDTDTKLAIKHSKLSAKTTKAALNTLTWPLRLCGGTFIYLMDNQKTLIPFLTAIDESNLAAKEIGNVTKIFCFLLCGIAASGELRQSYQHSIKQIAEDLRMNPHTVCKYLKFLEDVHLITRSSYCADEKKARIYGTNR